MVPVVNAANTLLVTVGGFLLNFLTIWMVSRHTQQEMRIYSRILLQTCVTDLLALCINALVQPVFFLDSGVGTVWSYGPAHLLPNPWQCLFFLLFVFMMRFSTTSISSLFIYRFLVVNRNVTMTMRRYACLLVAVSLPVALLAGVSFVSNCPSASNEHLTNPMVAAILKLDNLTMQQFVVPLRANGENGGTKFVTVYAMALSIGSYVVVVFCGIGIQWHIRQRYTGPTMAVKRRVNNQITLVLVAQALLPLLSLLPHLIVNSILYFKLSRGALIYVGMFVTVPVTWIVVLNPLITLLSVQNYRQTLFLMVAALCGQSRREIENKFSCRPKKNTSSNEILEPEQPTDGNETLL